MENVFLQALGTFTRLQEFEQQMLDKMLAGTTKWWNDKGEDITEIMIKQVRKNLKERKSWIKRLQKQARAHDRTDAKHNRT